MGEADGSGQPAVGPGECQGGAQVTPAHDPGGRCQEILSLEQILHLLQGGKVSAAWKR